ncbi:UPF0176 protein Cgl2992/cg3319 [Actinomycetes bacterium]|nr:UPF0176 protein Cgl2992/cg3319 [Actinomycetes bacterium]
MTAIEPVKILLFYKFTPLADPEAIRLWQRTLCENLELTGRIIISKDGINGTVGGSLSAIKKYRRSTCEFAPFRDIDFKWSDGIGGDFPRLAVRVREEIVTFGVPDEVVVDHQGIVGGATHLTPHELHALVDQRGDELVFFDGRNEFESRIGRFKNAVIPNIKTTPEFVQELESGKFDHLKDKPIVTYCTGGIRCEVLSVIMKNRGFQEVYQMDGGIVRYGETFGDSHLWEGSLYVFDSRLKMDFSENPQIIGKCQSCDEPTNQFHNCSDPACHTLTLVCDSCWQLHPLVQCETCLA